LALTEESQASHRVHAALVQAIEHKRHARSIHVPTVDADVKAKLRGLGHPICLFGEFAHNRRDRLREILANMDATELEALKKDQDESSSDEEIHEEFFTEGNKALKDTRTWIAHYSLPRAKVRLAQQKEELAMEPAAVLAPKNEVYQRLKHFTNSGSQIGDDRPLAHCCFTNDSQQLVTGSWSGGMKLWNVPSSLLAHTWRGHEQRIGGIDVHPESSGSLSRDAANLISGCAEGKVFLWNLTQFDPVGELVGHKMRVAQAAFHPSGRFAGTSSYDTSWRLWDVETRQEILLQEGHFNEVHGLSFHCDGSLVATSGLDCYVRLWDLRSGRGIGVLAGHVKQIHALDFSPNGHVLASGSDDNTVRIWDLRKAEKKRTLYTIPAHRNLISHVKFEPVHGTYLVTSSFDNTVGLWASTDWKNIKTLVGHANKVMCADTTRDGKIIASCSYDRTFKLWEQEAA